MFPRRRPSVPRFYPEPDWSRSVFFIGDAHPPALLEGRKERVAEDYAALPAPLAYVQVGDETNDGKSSSDAIIIPWLEALSARAPAKVIRGNHDCLTNNRTEAQWETAYAAFGAKERQEVKLGPFTLLMVGPKSTPGTPIALSTETLEWLSAALAAATQPCIVVGHAPLQNTVLGWRPSTSSNYFIHSEAHPTSSIDIIKILSEHTSVFAYISGHTHSDPFNDDNCIARRQVHPRAIASVNASALHYVGGTPATLAMPLRTVLVTIPASGDRVEARVRDHKLSQWVASRPLGVVATVMMESAESSFEYPVLTRRDRFQRSPTPPSKLGLSEAPNPKEWTNEGGHFQIIGDKLVPGGNTLPHYASLPCENTEVRVKCPITLGSADVPPETKVSDTFHRANGVLGVADTGQTWTIVSERLRILEDKAAPSAGLTTQGVAYLPCPIGNCTVSGGIQLSAVRAQIGCTLRVINSTNYLFVELQREGATNAIRICKRVEGTKTVLAENTSAGLASGSEAVVAVTMNEGELIVKVGGVTKLTWTLSKTDLEKFPSTLHQHGLYISCGASTGDDGGSRWSSFTVETLEAPAAGNAGIMMSHVEGPHPEKGVDGPVSYLYCAMVKGVTGAGKIILGKNTEGVVTELAEVAETLALGNTYNLEMQIFQGIISVIFEGATVLEHTLTEAELELFVGHTHGPYLNNDEHSQWHEMNVYMPPQMQES